MNKIFKLFVMAGLLFSAILAVTGCADNWTPPYENLNKDGYSVSVKFDANGGVTAGGSQLSFMDVFSINQVTDGKGVYLLMPDNDLRQERKYVFTKTGYFLAGWYEERTPRVDENNNPLDDYGNPTSETGLPQGFIYGKKWDFEKDTLSLPAGEYSADKPVLTLYAAWVPYIEYEIYATENGESIKLESIKGIDLEIPTWNEKTGKLNKTAFPERDGYTLDGVFTDKECTAAVNSNLINASENVNYDTATLTVPVVKLYTTWLEGDWFRISTPLQLISNAKADGNYILSTDLDFADSVWPAAFSENSFSGSFIGNGHKICNVSYTQVNTDKTDYGIFGTIEANASFKDIAFEDAQYCIQNGSKHSTAKYGLLAGTVSKDAVFDGFEISGKLVIDGNSRIDKGNSIGLLYGMGNANGVSFENIQCVKGENSEFIDISVDESGFVTVSVTAIE